MSEDTYLRTGPVTGNIPAELDAEGLNLNEELPHIDNLVPN
jgi:hypothetical protein